MNEHDSGRSKESWWVSINGQPTGPLSDVEIRQRLEGGELQPEVYVCRVGTEVWKKLAECNEFHDAMPANTPPLPPDFFPSTETKTKPVWNPQAIAWLGLLFLPAWTGGMAVINARRLGMDQPLWRPLAIGMGSTVLAMLAGCAGIEFGLILEVVIFTIAPLIAIYHLDLAPQEKAYAARQTFNQDHWIAPVLAGSPLALLTIAGWWMTLFGPLEPIEVVKRFVDAETAEEARAYATSNLYQMVDDIEELEKLDPSLAADDGGEMEYLNKYYNETDNNQYFIEYRMYAPAHAGEPSTTMEGHFRLQWLEDAWKIEDWIVTEINGQEPDVGPVPFSMIVSEMLKDARSQTPSKPIPKTEWILSNLWNRVPTNLKRIFAIMSVFALLGAARALFNINIKFP